MEAIDLDEHWNEIRRRAHAIVAREPALLTLLNQTVLDRQSFAECLTYRLTRKLVNHAASIDVLHETFMEAFMHEPKILQQVACDMNAVYERDPACPDVLTPLLYFKGFQAIVCYRVGHHLWNSGRHEFALYLQSLISETFAVDIHPAAQIGCGILLDHATGFVAGETSVVEDNVSILHEVTLGGTGKDRGDRHPKVRSGVLLGAGAKILGNVEIGEGAKVGAGSVVLKPVPPHTSVAGVPAQIIGKTKDVSPALGMCHDLDD
ncbi:serine O-acetyltransferase [Coraliomargarita parva]|uniref:serine O-acetyltransferase n=1 Tax=Coraliomargarita parva TaxID=3014050 RepID=UPI0022B2F976|nr:serine O-acetyltransferase [Coraliomargarita parva]